MLTWNAEEKTIYAGLGGVVTHAEAAVLVEEIEGLLDLHGSVARVELDAVRTHRFSDGAMDEIEGLRFLCSRCDAHLELMLEEPADEMSANVRAILEGAQEDFSLIRKAA